MESAHSAYNSYSRTTSETVIETSCLIIGAGPAGMAPLVAAARSEKLRTLLKAGVVLVEASPSVGCGDIGHYTINSDSAAEAFLDAVTDMKHPQLSALKNSPLAAAIRKRTGQWVPLKMVARFLQQIGEALCHMVEESPRGHVLTQHRALHTRRTADGSWLTAVRDEQLGIVRQIRSQSVVLATGAEQPIARLYEQRIGGQPLLPTYAGKVVQSGYALTRPGLLQICNDLKQHEEPKVVIIGGSASAGAVAKLLLSSRAGIAFGAEGITLMHRRALRIFYPSVADAIRDGYTDFEPQDICPVSGRVYRLAGFRLESRELMMRALQVGGRESEPRLRLHSLAAATDASTTKILTEAHVVIAAIGYRPRALPVFDVKGNPLSLQCSTNEMVAMVGGSSNVLDEQGQPIEGLYGIGLASGFVPRGRFGGEPSFQGQANSLWLWQHDIGEQIAEAVTNDAKAFAPAELKIVHRGFVETLSKQEGAA